jgi:hypothetical protein
VREPLFLEKAQKKADLLGNLSDLFAGDGKEQWPSRGREAKE